MKINRFGIVVVTVAFLVFPILAFAQTAPTSFSDVPSSNPYYIDIQYAAAHGLMLGYGGGLFVPDGLITRGQTAIVLTRIFGWPLVTTTAFPDVPLTRSDNPYIGALYANHVAYGYTNGLFGPDDDVTRWQIAAFATRALALSTSSANAPYYTDESPASDPTGFPYIAAVANAGGGIMGASSCPPATSPSFCPDTTITRGEAAHIFDIIYRIATGVSAAPSAIPEVTSTISSASPTNTTPSPSVLVCPAATAAGLGGQLTEIQNQLNAALADASATSMLELRATYQYIAQLYATQLQGVEGQINSMCGTQNVSSSPSGVAPRAPTAPLASLIVNSNTNLTVNPGDTVVYSWAGYNGILATSSYTRDAPDTCSAGAGGTGPYPWIANNFAGVASSTVAACQAGRTYTISYQVIAAGGQTATSQVVVHVNGIGLSTSSSAPFAAAQIISPASSLVLGASNIFTWTPGTGVDQYWLTVSTAPNEGNIISSGATLASTTKVVAIPSTVAAGAPLYVRLWSHRTGAASSVWTDHEDYTYTAGSASSAGTGAAFAAAQIVSPTSSLALPLDTSDTFTWTTGAGVDQYWLTISTLPNEGNIISSGATLATTSKTVLLPSATVAPGTTLYVRLWSHRTGTASGVWTDHEDYTYTAGTAAVPPNSGVSFPTTITVTAATLNVRSAPNTSAPLAGSQVLYAGDTFTATNEVAGESVDGNDLWWVSSAGNYVWSGGTAVATTGGATPRTRTGTTTKTISDNSGNQYVVTYGYLPDGEVQATFIYQNKQYAVQNFNVFGTAGGLVLVQPDGSFALPWTGSANLTLVYLANQIALASPANQTVYPGFSFATPFFYITDGGDVFTPANAYRMTASSALNVPVPNLYDLMTDANGKLIGVTPVNISLAGAITTGTEITIQYVTVPASTTLQEANLTIPKISATELQNEIQNETFGSAIITATNAGYLVYVDDDGSSMATAIILDPITGAEVAVINEQDD